MQCSFDWRYIVLFVVESRALLEFETRMIVDSREEKQSVSIIGYKETKRGPRRVA